MLSSYFSFSLFLVHRLPSLCWFFLHCQKSWWGGRAFCVWVYGLLTSLIAASVVCRPSQLYSHAQGLGSLVTWSLRFSCSQLLVFQSAAYDPQKSPQGCFFPKAPIQVTVSYFHCMLPLSSRSVPKVWAPWPLGVSGLAALRDKPLVVPFSFKAP